MGGWYKWIGITKVTLSFEGALTHLRLISGGWVISKSPTTFEDLVEFTKDIGGGVHSPLPHFSFFSFFSFFFFFFFFSLSP